MNRTRILPDIQLDAGVNLPFCLNKAEWLPFTLANFTPRWLYSKVIKFIFDHHMEKTHKMPLNPELTREVAAQLQARVRKLGYSPGDYLFRVTVADVVTVLAQRLAKSGTQPEQLSLPDLDYLLDQASEYLNGEGLPSRKDIGTTWREMISLGLDEAWPEHLKETV